MKRALLPLLASLSLTLSGCAIFRHSESPKAASTEINAATLPRAALPVPTQTERAMAASTRQVAPAGYMPTPDRPIYNNPKIAKVVLAPHIDKNGRLYGAQEMYQVADEGGWNLEALEPGASGYIPATNVETPANIGNPVAAPVRRSPALPAESQHMVDRIDPENVVITGLLSQTDQTQANTMAAEKNMQATWDDQLGWILVPRASQ